jgi:hypothetical protein
MDGSAPVGFDGIGMNRRGSETADGALCRQKLVIGEACRAALMSMTCAFCGVASGA